MQKIISLFQRNHDGDQLVRGEIVLGAEWVAAGEGIATRKWDGTCCRITDEGAQSVIWKRYDRKQIKGTNPPRYKPADEEWTPAQEPDPVSGHWPGWTPCNRDDPADKWFFEAYDKRGFPEGTYELVGPRINGNPERYPSHVLLKHGDVQEMSVPRDFDGLREFFKAYDLEGIVWHHPDGRMVKIKGKDFGVKRPFTAQDPEGQL